MIESAVDYIRHWEGFRPRLYLCPAGYPTIGYGTRVATWRVWEPGHDAMTDAIRGLIADDTGDWITHEQATALMLPAVMAACKRCKDGLGTGWSALDMYQGQKSLCDDPDWADVEYATPRQISLIDLAYNIGGVSKFPRFVAAVKAGNWQRAHDELLYTSAPVPDRAGGPMRTHYYRQTGRRAECNARIILTGEMPEVLP